MTNEDNVNRSRHGEGLDPQEIPEKARCPECGAKATEESVREHKLAALGYSHDDIDLECTDCGHTFMLGVPIGDAPENPDLWCDACNRRARVHFIFPSSARDAVMLLLKCPECYLAWRTERPLFGGRALVGHSDVTGDTSAAVDADRLSRLEQAAEDAYQEKED